MTFYRHFVERDDFDIFVASLPSSFGSLSLSYSRISFDLPSWWLRIRRTRFYSFACTLEALLADFYLPPKLLSAARRFKPDCIFTMAGSWHWSALVARTLAKRLNIPLISSFNDWYDYPNLPGHPLSRNLIKFKFVNFYKSSDLALCTSEGMRSALGRHPNAHILYPTGAVADSRPGTLNTDRSPAVTVLFAGGLGEWHGPMLESLITRASVIAPTLNFRIFGSNPSWTDHFDSWVSSNGIYGGQIPFERLRLEAQQADILLLPMSFSKRDKIIQQTSFKTKLLDYISFARPILIWAPSYSSAVKAAQEFDAAQCVESSDPNDCIDALLALGALPARLEQLVQNGRNMYESRFNPELIHRHLCSLINSTLQDYASRSY